MGKSFPEKIHENRFYSIVFLDRLIFSVFLYAITMQIFLYRQTTNGLYVPVQQIADRIKFARVAKGGAPACLALFGIAGLYNYISNVRVAAAYLMVVVVIVTLTYRWLRVPSARWGRLKKNAKFTRQTRGKVWRPGSATVLVCQADWGARHGWLSLSMALRMTKSLRMAAVSASFLALPAATRRRWKARTIGLCRTATKAAM